MAKCVRCGFRYTKSKKCPNCNTRNSSGNRWIWLWLSMFAVVITWLIISYNHPKYHNIAQSKLQDNPINYDDDEVYNPSLNQKQKEYQCRECSKNIKWVGSYYWTYDNNTTNYGIAENTETDLEGDKKLITTMYTENGISSRGIFCSHQCAEKNLDRYLAQ